MFNVIKAIKMNHESKILKIERLARYLKIEDGLLIVQVGSSSCFLVFDTEAKEIKTESVPSEKREEWLMSFGKPFTFIKQRDEDGSFIVPDVDEWIRDEKTDY